MSKPLALIVEDHRAQAEIFAEALQMAGCQTEIIQDGTAALARLAVTTPAIVLLDLSLPHVSGEDILRRIRADPRLTRTRVLLATAEPQMAEVLNEKADLVLIKPLGFTQLCDLAARMLLSDADAPPEA